MNKMVNLLLVGLVLFLAACGQTASNPEVVEVNEAPTQVSGMAVEPTTEPTQVPEPTQAPTNTPELTPIPPTPTEQPPIEPGVFVSSGIKPEDLADKLLLGDLFEPNDILNKAITEEDISQFARELYATGLFISLLEIGPFTVFAPAYKYEDVPQGTFATPKDFIDALRSHIVPGSYLQADLLSMDGQSIPTILEGKNINITVKDGTVYINDVAMLTQPDILAQNGVVHVIDQFLLPAGE
jgi:uncharacterized surface protein with fasciclin (FAS1) repeats